MKERPILMSAPMVRALLDGSKTQTRRVVKGERASRGMESGWLLKPYGFLNDRQFAKAACPYGQPGDRLWVREAWRITGDSPTDRLDMFDIDDVQYRADDDQSYIDKYRPSIHMPRRFSRITLEITSVRVERLQNISEADARAEGVEPKASHARPGAIATCYGAYEMLWEQINGPGSWGANPWVWCVEFRRLP